MWRKFIVVLRRWCDRQLRLDPGLGVLMPSESSLLHATDSIIKSYETLHGVNKPDKYKRDRVHRTLIKKFPFLPHATIEIAIEVAYVEILNHRA